MKVHLFVGLLTMLPLIFGPCQRVEGEVEAAPEIPQDSVWTDNGEVPVYPEPSVEPVPLPDPPIRTGAEQFEQYQALLYGKKLALVVNHSSLVGDTHLVDTLLALGMDIQILFAPEHGFRGDAANGEIIPDERDPTTGLPIISLYGSKKKPAPADLSGIDLILFDIQDVGARFFTYLSTLHYVLQAAAEGGLPVLLLDRPNPNANYVDGPLMEDGFTSFVGLHPVPVVYGMTIGEYAGMINEEGWLGGELRADLEVIPLANYRHDRAFDLPVRPSPNLPNQRAVYLYPSLCFFEGTEINAGRGTDIPFQCFGAPDLETGDFYFTPVANPGALYPKHAGSRCRGVNLSELDITDLYKRRQLDLSYLLGAYRAYKDPASFFLSTGFFDKLAGTDSLRLQIIAGKTEDEIRQSWQPGLSAFRAIREKYLLYE